MDILYIVPYVPNPIRVRPFQLIHSLCARGHRVTLATVWASEQDRADLAELSRAGIDVVAARLPVWRSLGNSVQALLTQTPLQAVYSWHHTLAVSLGALLQNGCFDIIHVEHLRGARYGLHVKSCLPHVAKAATARKSLPIVWDSVDCISHLFEQAAQQSHSWKGRLLTRLELDRTRRHEGWLVHQFDQVVVTSATDRAALEQLAIKAAAREAKHHHALPAIDLPHKLHVVPNGVDLTYFAPNGTAREADHIVFTGKMSYHANVTAAVHLVQEIMPLIWAQHPTAQVWIVGKDPAPEVRALASQNGGRVVVTGTVPDLRPYLRKATLAVAPIPYGAGIQNKVLEAMACGTPVVASTQAASALAVAHGRELLIAADAAAHAAAISQLLAHPLRRDELGRSGRLYVEQNHSWNFASARLEAVYRQAVCAWEMTR